MLDCLSLSLSFKILFMYLRGSATDREKQKGLPTAGAGHSPDVHNG